MWERLESGGARVSRSHVSPVTCHNFFSSEKVVKIISGGSVINGACNECEECGDGGLFGKVVEAENTEEAGED